LGFREQGYELNILENGRKGDHFGGVRSPLPLLLTPKAIALKQKPREKEKIDTFRISTIGPYIACKT